VHYGEATSIAAVVVAAEMATPTAVERLDLAAALFQRAAEPVGPQSWAAACGVAFEPA
jgi:hypothetical protein